MKSMLENVALFLAVLLILRGCQDGGIGPGPKPNPPPFPTDALSVLIVEETAERGNLPAGQREILSSTPFREWCQRVGAELKIWDQDADLTNVAEKWTAAMSVPRQSVPWLIVADSDSGFSGPLPANVDATKEVINAVRQ